MSTGRMDTGMPNTYQPSPADDRAVAATGWGHVYEALARGIQECEDIRESVEQRTVNGADINGQVLRSVSRAESALRTAAFVLAASARPRS